MRNTDQRVEFFKLFARVMLYLTSGKAHVGYLFDYDGNPIHRIVSPTLTGFSNEIDSQNGASWQGGSSIGREGIHSRT